MRGLLLSLFLTLGTTLLAVEPSEVLDDPLLEIRARAISQDLRCLQCRNESIDESNSDIAQDMRILVRARLLAGDSDTEVIDYIVDRFGEYVLLRPNGTGANLVLWASGPLLLIITILGLYMARRATPALPAAKLSDEEERKIKDILSD